MGMGGRCLRIFFQAYVELFLKNNWYNAQYFSVSKARFLRRVSDWKALLACLAEISPLACSSKRRARVSRHLSSYQPFWGIFLVLAWVVGRCGVCGKLEMAKVCKRSVSCEVSVSRGAVRTIESRPWYMIPL